MNITEELGKHYEDNFDRLVKIYSRRCNGADNAEDVIQSGYTRALTYSSTFDGGVLDTWILSIIHNSFRAYLRDLYLNGMSMEFDETFDYIPRTLSSEEQDELIEDVYKVINSKGAVKSEVLTMVVRGGYTYSEIEKLTGVNVSSIKKWIAKLKDEMRLRWDNE